MNIFILDQTIDFLLNQNDYLENIEKIERLQMESNTIKAGLGLIDLNIETIFSKDIIWENINNSICSRVILFSNNNIARVILIIITKG